MGDSDIRAGPMQPSSYWTRLSESLLRLGQATRILRGLTQPSSHWTRMPSHRPGRSPRRSPDSRPHPTSTARLPGHVHAPVFGYAVPSRPACPRPHWPRSGPSAPHIRVSYLGRYPSRYPSRPSESACLARISESAGRRGPSSPRDRRSDSLSESPSESPAIDDRLRSRLPASRGDSE